jgi:hypothetical protein
VPDLNTRIRKALDDAGATGVSVRDYLHAKSCHPIYRYNRGWPGGHEGLRDAILEHLSTATSDGWESVSFLLTTVREQGFKFINVRSVYDFADLCEALGFSQRRRSTGPRGYVTEIGV